ncbi:unnamed protein product [Closterium sp. Naga37s-1]|nr:unnamed protein product [Closterium sp. Naga37s-1]
MMHRPIRVHVVWYGSAFTERFKSAVRLFVSSLAPSADPAVTVPLWWNVNRMYYDSDGRNVTANITLGQEATVTSSGNLTTFDATVDVVRQVLDAGKLPISADDIYLLLTDKNTVQSGSKENAGARWCSSYCAWHTFFDYNTTTTAAAGGSSIPSSIVAKIAWVGDPTIYCPGCGLTTPLLDFFPSPNGDPVHEAIISFIAHEIAETASSWNMRTWLDSGLFENADKCQTCPITSNTA